MKSEKRRQQQRRKTRVYYRDRWGVCCDMLIWDDDLAAWKQSMPTLGWTIIETEPEIPCDETGFAKRAGRYPFVADIVYDDGDLESR